MRNRPDSTPKSWRGFNDFYVCVTIPKCPNYILRFYIFIFYYLKRCDAAERPEIPPPMMIVSKVFSVKSDLALLLKHPLPKTKHPHASNVTTQESKARVFIITGLLCYSTNHHDQHGTYNETACTICTKRLHQTNKKLLNCII